MKIGIDCRLWNETGVGRYIRNLVTQLASIDSKNSYTLFFRKNEFETIPLPGKNFEKKLADVQWHTLNEQIKLKNILSRENLDLMHFPYFSYPIGYKGKFVITIHDLIIDHFPTGKASTLAFPVYFLKQLGYRFILQNSIKNAKKLITVSGATKQEIIDHYHPVEDKIVVTPEGVDANFFTEKEEKVDVPQKYFLYVGNVYPHKNANRLVDAFSLIQESNPDTHLIFVGKEDYFSKKLEQYVLLKHYTHILFYRNISDAQLSYLYHRAIALVTVSLMEGFGLPALEAMAHNCVVVASEIPAFLEVCAGIPLYIDPLNTQDIAKKLTMAYKDEKNSKERKKQGILQAKKFSWKKMAQQTLEIYETC